MTRFFDALGRFSVRFRYPIVLVWLAGAVAASQLLPTLASAVNNDNTAFLPSDSPSVRAVALAAPFQRSDQAPVTIVASRADGALTSADQAAVDRLVTAAKRVPDVAVARETGVSPDGRAAQLLLIILVIGAGTDYGLFLVFRVREELRAGLAPKAAVARAVARVGESITFSAGTVIAAVLCLLLAAFGFYNGLAYPLGIGIAMMLLAGLTLLPALLAIFGRAAFWPSNVRPGPPRIGAWGRIAARVISRPALTLAIGVVAFGGLSLAALGYEPSGFGGTSGAPEGSDSAAGNAALASHFPQAAANPTNLLLRLPAAVWERPQPLEAAGRQLAGDPAFKSVIGPLDPTGTPLAPDRLTSLHAKLGPAQQLASVPPAGLLSSAGVTPAEYQVYRATAQFIAPDGKTV